MPDGLGELSDADLQDAAQDFLDVYFAAFQPQDHSAARIQAANEALAQHTNRDEVVELARAFLDERVRLRALQVRQLEAMIESALDTQGGQRWRSSRYGQRRNGGGKPR